MEHLEHHPLCAVPLAFLRHTEPQRDLSIRLALLGEMLLNSADPYQASIVCILERFRVNVDNGFLGTLVKDNQLLMPLGNEGGNVIG